MPNVFEDGVMVLDFALAIDGDDFAVRLAGRRPSRSRDRAPPSARNRRPAAPAPWRGSGHDNPIFTAAFLKCKAVSRAVPSALSCSCGFCRISSEIRLSIAVTLSQMQSGSGFRQRGQSGVVSAAAEPASGFDCFDVRPLYARDGAVRSAQPPPELFRRRPTVRPDPGPSRRRSRSIRR